nr:MAG: RNA-dependent RNA polymerase [Dichorhavirus sp. 'monocotyledonae']
MEGLFFSTHTEGLIDHPDDDRNESEATGTSNDYHLTSALRTASDYLKNNRQARDLRLLRLVSDTPHAKNPCKLLPILWSLVMTAVDLVCTESWNEIQSMYKDDEANREMRNLVNVELNTLLSSDETRNLTTMLSSIVDRSWNLNTYIGRLNAVRFCLTHLIINQNRGKYRSEDAICLNESEDVSTYHYHDNFRITASECWASVHICGESKTVHMSHLINLLDKITERYNVLIYNELARATSMASSYPPTDILLQIIQAGDDLLTKEGNEGYRGLASYEALCVGEIINKGDGTTWDISKFLFTMIREVSSMGVSFDLWCSTITSCLRPLNIQQISCLHGIYRIWGHIQINTSNMFKETFFSNYYKKHKFYPPHSWLGPSSPNYIRQSLLLGKEIDRHNVKYHIEDWSYVQCEKTFEIPSTYSLASCIKDRAVSPKRSELRRMVAERHTVMDQKSRRGVLRWLNSKMMPVRDFLRAIDENGLPLDDCIIGLYPKERELKLEARYFSLMSFNMRLYFTITEHLANDNLLEYFPMVTMSDSMLDLQKKLDSLSKKQVANKSGVVHYVVNIDFRKWNQQMREEMTIHLFRDTDRLFGFNNLIGRTHEIFRNSYIYLSSGEYVPAPTATGLSIDPPYSWTKDPSGKEGLRQKYWTIMTACDLMFVARKHNMKIDLVGGGDNQVLIVEVSTDQVDADGSLTYHGKMDCRNKMEGFMSALSDYMEKKGLPLKVEETWISPDLLMFFKMMYFRHITLISPFKQASRVFPLSNDQVMTVGNMASTVSSAVTVLSSKDMQMGPSIILGRLVVADLSNIVSKNHPLSRTGSLWSDKIVICRGGQRKKVSVRKNCLNPARIFLSLTLHHKVMGGAAIISPLGMMMRGFPDPLCEHLTWMMMLGRQTRRYELFSCMNINSKTPWSHLLEDPVSVNHDAPMHGLAVLRREAESALANAKGYTNEDFLELARSCNKEASEGLAAALCSGDEIDIRILHDIMGANLSGYFNSIASKVNKASTVLKMNRSSKVLETITGQERVCMSYFATYGNYGMDLKPGDCPTETARRYREISWGKRLLGITTPHPAAFLEYIGGKHDCDHNYVQSKTSSCMEINPFLRGPYLVYQGSYTKEKFKPTEMAAAYGEEDLLSRAIHLMKLINWRYSPESTMARVIRGLLSSLTDAEPSLFYGMMEWISGDAEHRYQDMATKHGGVPNISYSILSYVRINTSTFRRHSRGGKNETLHFQALMIYTSMMCLFKNYGGIGHWHENCSKCIRSTTSNPDFKPRSTIGFPTLPNNMFSYVPAEQVKFHYHDMKKIQMQESMDRRMTGYSTMTPEDKARTAVSLLSAVIVASSGKDRTSDTVSSIMMWNSSIHMYHLIPMVCMRLSVEHLIKRHEWTWPHPSLPKRVLRLLEPFIMSPSGRVWLSQRDVDISETDSGNYELFRDIVFCVMQGAQMPKVFPNRVSPMWMNDVICAKIYENQHMLDCSACLNGGSSLGDFDVCHWNRIYYSFRICSVTLPVLKGDISQIERSGDFSLDIDWTMSPVQIFTVMEDDKEYVPFPKDGPIAKSIPLGTAGIASVLDIIEETSGGIIVSTDSVSLTIWRKFYSTRRVQILNESQMPLDMICDMNQLDIPTTDNVMDDEFTSFENNNVYFNVRLAGRPGWWIVTSRDDLNTMYALNKEMKPVSVMSSGMRVCSRTVCAVLLSDGEGGGWGSLQSLYRSLEGRKKPYVSKVRIPVSRTKIVSLAVSLYQANGGSYSSCLSSLTVELRTLAMRSEIYSRKGRDLMYLAIVMKMAGEVDGINRASKLGRIKYLKGQGIIKSGLSTTINRKAVSDVRDIKEIFKHSHVQLVTTNQQSTYIIL